MLRCGLPDLHHDLGLPCSGCRHAYRGNDRLLHFQKEMYDAAESIALVWEPCSTRNSVDPGVSHSCRTQRASSETHASVQHCPKQQTPPVVVPGCYVRAMLDEQTCEVQPSPLLHQMHRSPPIVCRPMHQ